MMGLKFSNFGKAIVASAPVGVGGLSFTVEAAKGVFFPVLGAGDYFYGLFKDASGNREVVKITARSTDAMTIPVGGRGLDGTVPRTWAAGDYFVLGVTNIALQESLSNLNLGAIGALVSAADKLPYFTGAGLAALTDFPAYARTLLAAADAATARGVLGAAPETLLPAGTSMLFYMATAPAGWTTDIAALNHALRVVPGATSGGSAVAGLDFTAAFASRAVSGSNSATTLNSTQIPAHTHTYIPWQIGGGLGNGGSAPGSGAGAAVNTDNGTGGGLSHNHTFTGAAINLAVSYLNMIRATKN